MIVLSFLLSLFLPSAAFGADYIVQADETVRDTIIHCSFPDRVVMEANSRLVNVDVRGCPVAIVGVSGVEVWDSRVRHSWGDGYLIRDAQADLMGVFVNAPDGDGIHVENSTVRTVASLVYNSNDPAHIGISYDATSYGAVFASRSRYGSQAIAVPDLEQVGMGMSICGNPLGAAVCAPGRYGSPVALMFRICGSKSYQNGGCDWSSPAEAFANGGITNGIYVVDTPPGSTTWGAFTISASGVIVRSNTDGGSIGGAQGSGSMQGAYKYFNPVAGYATLSSPTIFSGFRVNGDDLFYDVQ